MELLGSEAQVMYGFERGRPNDRDSNNVYKNPAVNKALRFSSLTGALPSPEDARTENMDNSGQTLEGDTVGLDVAFQVNVDADVDNVTPLMFHQLEHYTSIDDLGGGAFQWNGRPYEKVNDVAIADEIHSAAFEVDAGDGHPYLLTGCRMVSRVLTIAKRALQKMTFGFGGCFYTFSNDSAEVAVNAASTGYWIVRGPRDDDTSTDAIKIKVLTPGGSGAAKVAFTKGATGYGATEHTVHFFVPGTSDIQKWIRVTLADDSRAGLRRHDEYYALYVDPADAAALTLDDEWSIAQPRVAATPSYSDRTVLQSAGVIIDIDGREITVDSGTLSYLHPLNPKTGTGSLYNLKHRNDEVWGVQFAISTDADNRDILRAMLKAKHLSARVDLYGRPIAASGFDELLQTTIPKMKVSQYTRDFATRGILPESCTLQGERVGGQPIFTEKSICTLSGF